MYINLHCWQFSIFIDNYIQMTIRKVFNSQSIYSLWKSRRMSVTKQKIFIRTACDLTSVKMFVVLSSSVMLIILCYTEILPIVALNSSWLDDTDNGKMSFDISPLLFNQNPRRIIKFVYHTIPTASIDSVTTKIKSSTTLLDRKIKKKDNELRKSEQACMKFKSVLSSGQRPYHLTGTQDILEINSTISLENIKWQLPAKIHTVVGGKNTVVGEFPHVAALGSIDMNGNFILHCGGTLIDRKWILTAAHCTQSSVGHLTTARLGITNLRTKLNNNDGTVGIKEVIRHSLYKPPEIYFDIALLELDRLINFTSSIRPACLHQNFNDAPDNAWVCGWGTTEFGERGSDILLKAHLKVLDNVWCSSKLNQSMTIPRGIVPSMICAGSPDDDWSKDTCQGDSGGPLQIALPYHCLFSIIGITSFGASCALNESPGVYTRVSHYIQWIEDIVWP